MQNNSVAKPKLPKTGQRGTFEVRHANADGSVSGTFTYRHQNIENSIIRQEAIRSISPFMVGRHYSVDVTMTDGASRQVICRLTNRVIGQKGIFIPTRMISHTVIEGKLKTDTTERDNVELHATDDQPFSDAIMQCETNAIIIEKKDVSFICIPVGTVVSHTKQDPDFMKQISNRKGTVKIQKLTLSKKNMIGPLLIQGQNYGVSLVEEIPSDIDKKELIGKTLNVIVKGYDNNSGRVICQYESLCKEPVPDQNSLLTAYVTKGLLFEKDLEMNLVTTIKCDGNEYQLQLKDNSLLIADHMNRFYKQYSDTIRKTTNQLNVYYSRIIKLEQKKKKEKKL